jgi:hypothetical protein
MPSTFVGFDVLIDGGDGTQTPVPSHVVKVYDVTNEVALADLASDAAGHVPASVLAVAVGTLVRFAVQRADLVSGYAEQITT